MTSSTALARAQDCSFVGKFSCRSHRVLLRDSSETTLHAPPPWLSREPIDLRYDVMFVCTANSARSIVAEAILNRFGDGRFNAVSSGVAPSTEVNPLTLEVLERFGCCPVVPEAMQ